MIQTDKDRKHINKTVITYEEIKKHNFIQEIHVDNR